ncbi:MAG TPA: hypothetical protein VGK22_16690 [Candidatus Angelobacter sp.]|jgi:uncharacterized protein YdeI (BOF family)
MKKLFILICTLALGSALGFAQAGGGKPENQTPSASTTQGSATDSATTTKTKKSKVKKTKKAKKGATDTPPSAAPATTPK